MGQLALDQPEVALYRLQPGGVLRGEEEEDSEPLGSHPEGVRVMDAGIVKHHHHRAVLHLWPFPDLFQKVVDELLEHLRRDPSLHELVGQTLLLGDRADERHGVLLPWLGVLAYRELPGINAAWTQLLLVGSF